MSTEPESGFGLPEIIIVIVFMLFVSFLGMRIYEGYLQKTVDSPRANAYLKT